MTTLRSPVDRRKVLERLVVLSYWLTSSALLLLSLESGRAESTTARSNGRLDELNEIIGGQPSNSISKSEAEAAYFNGYQFHEEHPFFAAKQQNFSNNIGKTAESLGSNRLEQLNSFYSFGEPTVDNHHGDHHHLGRESSQNFHQSSRDKHIRDLALRDEPIESVLLQSYGLELAPEPVLPAQTPQLAFRDSAEKQIASAAASYANELAAKRVELSRMTQQVIDARHQKQLQLEQANKLARLRQLQLQHQQQRQPNLTFAQSQAQQEQILHPPELVAEAQRPPPPPPPPPPFPSSPLNAVYRPSILERTRPAIPKSANQTSTSSYQQQQVAAQKQARQITPGKERNNQPVSIDEIEDLLQRLKPLALRDFEKVSSSTEDSDDSLAGDQDDDDSNESGDSRESAPTNTISQASRSLSSQDSNEILLNSLADLGSKLKHSTESFIRPLEIGFNELSADEKAAPLDPADRATSSYGTSREQRNGRSPRGPHSSYGREQELGSSSGGAIQSIPIDLLVDHLMSSSRLMRSRQNDDDGPGEDQMGEDDDDDEYDEQTSGSNLNLAKVTAPMEVALNESTGVLNNTAGSWIPIARVSVGLNNSNRTVATAAQTQTTLAWPPPDPLDGGEAAPKKSRNKRRSGAEMNLVIGGKHLSRTDLIKLIKILNKMASKREPSKEREASRKLLRFLVKLALDEYKRTKIPGSTEAKEAPTKASKKKSSQKDSIQDLLRSMLMSPMEVSRSRNDTSSIKLRQFAKGDDRSKTKDSTDAIAAANDDDIDDERVSQDSQSKYEASNGLEDPKGGRKEEADKSEAPAEARETNKRPNNLRFNKLAEDMEQYFDSDFFEDLADKAVPGNTSTASASEHNKVKSIPKRRRSSRQGSNLPTPVRYSSRQSAGENDYNQDDDYEGDVDQPDPRPSRDKARRSKSKVGRKRSKSRSHNNSSSSRTGQGFVESRVLPRGSGSRQRRRRLQRPPRERYNEDKDDERGQGEDDDQDESEERRPESSSRRRVQSQRPQRRQTNRSRRRAKASRRYLSQLRPTEAPSGGRGDEENVDGGVEGEDEQQAPHDGREAGENSPPSGDDREQDTTEGDVDDRRYEKSRDSSRSHRRRRRKRKRNVNRAPQIGKGLRRGEVDLDSRDEIPAPIEKGRSGSIELQPSLATNFTVNVTAKANMMKPDYAAIKLESFDNKTTSRSTSLPTNATANTVVAVALGESRKVGRIGLGVAGSNRTKVTTRPSRGGKFDSEGGGRAKAFNEKDNPDESAGDIAEGDEDDGEYYKEGTSYSKICDDDGKCEVTVQSSSPKLNKAIEAGDRPAVNKQLGKWIAEDPPD